MRLAFLVEALNDLYILARDIHNAYLNAPTKEKVFFYTGGELKSDQVNIVVIVIALSCLKQSDVARKNNIYEILGNLFGF